MYIQSLKPSTFLSFPQIFSCVYRYSFSSNGKSTYTHRGAQIFSSMCRFASSSNAILYKLSGFCRLQCTYRFAFSMKIENWLKNMNGQIIANLYREWCLRFSLQCSHCDFYNERKSVHWRENLDTPISLKKIKICAHKKTDTSLVKICFLKKMKKTCKKIWTDRNVESFHQMIGIYC